MRYLVARCVVLCVLSSSLSSINLLAQEQAPPEQDLQKVFPKKPPYSPYADRTFLSACIGVTRTCTRRSRLMPGQPVAALAHGMRTGLLKANKSWLLAANPQGFRVRWTSWS